MNILLYEKIYIYIYDLYMYKSGISNNNYINVSAGLFVY